MMPVSPEYQAYLNNLAAEDRAQKERVAHATASADAQRQSMFAGIDRPTGGPPVQSRPSEQLNLTGGVLRGGTQVDPRLAGPNEHVTPEWQRNPGANTLEQDTIPYRAPAAPPASSPVIATKVDAKWQPQSRSVQEQSGVNFSDQTMGALGASEQHARAAAEQQTKAEQLQNEQRARMLRYDIAQSEADHVREQALKQEHASKLLKERNRLEQLQDEAREGQVDPGRMYRNMSTAGKVSSFLALALGGFAAGLRGGPNQALEQLNRLQDEDINLQREELAKGRQKAEDAKGLFAMMKEQFGDEEQAASAARIFAKEQRAKEIEAMMAGTHDALIRARGEQLLAANEKEIAKERGQFESMAATRRTSQLHEQYIPEHYVYSGGGPAGGSRAGTIEGEAGLYVPTGNGSGVLARSKEEADKLRARMAARDTINANLSQLSQMEQGASAIDKANPYSDYNRRRERLIADTEAKKTVFEGQGAMSEGDKQVTDQAIAAARGLGRLRNNTQLYQDAIQTMNRSVNDSVRAQGSPTVRETYVPNVRNGQLQRQYQVESLPGESRRGPPR